MRGEGGRGSVNLGGRWASGDLCEWGGKAFPCAYVSYVSLPFTKWCLIARWCGPPTRLALAEHPGGGHMLIPALLLLGMVCISLPPSQVWAADLVPERLALAGRLGATPLDLTALDVVDTVRGATEGR